MLIRENHGDLLLAIRMEDIHFGSRTQNNAGPLSLAVGAALHARDVRVYWGKYLTIDPEDSNAEPSRFDGIYELGDYLVSWLSEFECNRHNVDPTYVRLTHYLGNGGKCEIVSEDNSHASRYLPELPFLLPDHIAYGDTLKAESVAVAECYSAALKSATSIVSSNPNNWNQPDYPVNRRKPRYTFLFGKRYKRVC